ncbi:MAG: SDR family oxidoreductase [Myxococcales bacterium]
MSGQSSELRAGAQKLRLVSWGDTGRPVVLLVHGYPDTHTVWTKVAEDLARDHHVVAFDVRGAGNSDAPRATKSYRLDEFTQDLRAVIDHVSPGRPVHVVGHDWGSIHSWESVTSSDFKGRIASFTSISGPCLDHAAHWIRAQLRRPSLGNLRKLVLQLVRSWYVMAFHLPAAGLAWRLGLARLWPRLLWWTERVQAEASPTQSDDGSRGVAMYRANFLRALLFPRRRVAQAPVQVIAPQDDLYVSPALSEQLTAWVPQLWRREVQGGHWLPLKNPGLVADYVRDFVNSVDSGVESGPLRRARVGAELKPYSGKLVVVTGGGSGIGRSMALAVAEQGGVVVAADVDAASAERTAVLARLLGAEAHAYTVDVGDAQAMEQFAHWVHAQLGTPDVVINNAGIGMAGGVLETSVEHWERILRVNLWGVIHGSRLFGRQMAELGNGGHIVNVASAAAFAPSRTYPAYATTKAATLMLTECLRAELAPLGIGVSAACPGFVETGIANATLYTGVDAREQARRRNNAQRLYQLRGFTPEKVTRAILRAIRKNQPVALIGAEALGAHLMSRLSPGLSRMVARIDMTPK